MNAAYNSFIAAKRHSSDGNGFAPTFAPGWLFDFQSALVEWSVRRGRAAIFADCGLGKTPIELVWSQNIVEHSNKPVLILAPLAVVAQTVREGEKFGVTAHRSSGGTHDRAEIVVTNFEKLHLFNSADFAGVVIDESSILKNFDGSTRTAINEFLRNMPYRLLCTATAAPNDHIELGTSSEAVGELGYMDMLSTFFKNDEGSISPMAYESKFRFKAHAEQPFWRWMCSWARALRKPSDLGFDDARFVLPRLMENIVTVAASRPMDGFLFPMPARDLNEQRKERRATIQQRCETVAELAPSDRPFVAWCHLNDEADLLERLIPNAIQVSGRDSDESKEEKFEAFRLGQAQLVTKAQIAAFGLNWQHCADMSAFPSHSFEQYYQQIRRCWRFGQERDVTVHVVTTEGEADVLGNLKRKAADADRMFESMVREMHAAQQRSAPAVTLHKPNIPNWLTPCA